MQVYHIFVRREAGNVLVKHSHFGTGGSGCVKTSLLNKQEHCSSYSTLDIMHRIFEHFFCVFTWCKLISLLHTVHLFKSAETPPGHVHN